LREQAAVVVELVVQLLEQLLLVVELEEITAMGLPQL
jgi:hypothetical protein